MADVVAGRTEKGFDMEMISVKAPARADLAGGSLDLWPLGLMVEGAVTVNVALSLMASVVVTRTGGDRMKLISDDFGVSYEWDPHGPPGGLPLVERFCRHFGIEGGWDVRCACDSPPGAGLGGSSALSVALCKALSAAAEREMTDTETVLFCRDIEAAQIRIPTGVQDFWPALLGGALSIEYPPGGESVEKIGVDLETLGDWMVLAYSGISRLSAGTNWSLIKRFLDGEATAREGLEKISETAVEMRAALRSSSIEKVGKLLSVEWGCRKNLAPGISTPELEAIISSALGAGAIGGKACGAGGGGCAVFIAPPERKNAVECAIISSGAEVLKAGPFPSGCSMEVTR